MTRESFVAQLDALNRELEQMGSLVQQAVAKSVIALVTRNTQEAQAVITGDEQVNSAYGQIESLCLGLLALQQPMAGDLRRIAATLKVITDLERMADHAVDIAKVAVRLSGQPLAKPLVDIPAMAVLVQSMLNDAIGSFLRGNREQALAMIAKENEVDQLHRQVVEELQRLMKQHPETVDQAVQLLFVSSALERIGDHATNLGEWLIYRQTGERTDLNR